MEYDGHLLSLAAEAERQHAIVSQWESQNNKLYKNNRNTATRWQTHRRNTDPDFNNDQGLSTSVSSILVFAIIVHYVITNTMIAETEVSSPLTPKPITHENLEPFPSSFHPHKALNMSSWSFQRIHPILRHLWKFHNTEHFTVPKRRATFC